MVKKTAFGISATVTFVIAAAAIWLLVGGGEVLAKSLIINPHYDRRVSQFQQLPVRAGDTVFLGDSLTDFGPWQDLFPETRTTNRGVVGDDTAGVLARLNEVTAGKPGQVFLLIGTNDLSFGVDEDEIVANVEDIISTIDTESPDTEVFVQSVLPRAQSYRERVESLNRSLRSAVSDKATWIDLYPHFLDEDGSIIDEYSNDELHLFGEAYLMWRDILQQHVNTHTP
jgi:lysophospholipase L1-like esterase